MTEQLKTSPPRPSEVTVNSDWLTTVEAVAGLIVCSLLLIGEIRHFVWGHFAQPAQVRRDFFGIFNEVLRAIACVLAFVLAFEFRKKPLKVACFLGGLSLAAGSLLGFIHITSGTLHAVAMATSVMRQVTLVLFLVAIAQWFKSVIRKAPTEPAGGAS